MPYIVTNSDGSLTVTVQDSVVDTSTYSLALIGRNVSNFGQYFAQNTIRHLENFASSVAPSPSTRLVGQLWYDKTEEVMKVFDGTIWKRATNIVVGPENERPNYSLTGGGAAFFNTTNNKLEVHNGTAFVDAGYAGEVANKFAASAVDGSPTFYGARVRTLFLKEQGTGKSKPCLALIYSKSATGTSANLGHTEVGNQKETIMCLVSDESFIVADAGIEVEGNIVNYFGELTNTGGIASAREGRVAGQIFKGINYRAEYEAEGVTAFNILYVTQLGDPTNPVDDAFFNNITVDGSLTVLENSLVNITDSSVYLSSVVTIEGEIALNGNVTVTTGVGDSFTVNGTTNLTGDITLDGNVVIKGNLEINGDNIDNIGTNTSRIETIFGSDGNFTDITVSNEVNFSNATVVSDIDMGAGFDINLSGSGVLNGYATKSETNLITNTNATGPYYLTLVDGVTGDRALNADSNLQYNASTNTLSTTTFSGTATKALYADLAEIYAADADYTPGTVVKIGGEAEITQTTAEGDVDVFGVISTDPAYLMNSGAQGVPVALQGRVPVRVVGVVNKGDRLMSSGEAGVATAFTGEYDPRKIIGRALENKTDSGIGLVEAVVGVK